MPYTVQKRGDRYAIVNKSTGKVAGYSGSKANAQASARARNAAHKPSAKPKK